MVALQVRQEVRGAKSLKKATKFTLVIFVMIRDFYVLYLVNAPNIAQASLVADFKGLC